MAQFTRIEVAVKMQEAGIVPVFYHSDIDVCKKVVKACYDGGIRIFEYTNRGDFATLVFAALNQWAAKELPDMILGVGSIVDEATTAMYIALGANFIVSPVLDEGMASVCNKRKILWSPGCGSITEINKAHELGSEIVKIFPGSQVGGPGFIKAMHGPMPWTSIMVTGGVQPTEESLKSWFDAGATCVGMGSQLFTKRLIEDGDFGSITENVKKALTIIKRINL
ncbi:MAG: bifunctional 4-hydroxy-2-oxoglutarate aldolase/2-dehydro-3-deoxy-phosphogluconate aldolase [Mariniphaga sp.]|nr:bifunctional 4-hydroxy-2-oxoglutarate aldolase/2-dehydro-3-deoxy-phosphogluconate aldolase [Mariniphaga sp.]